MDLYLYSEMNIVCFLILGILLYRMIRNSDKQHSNYIFSYIIILAMIFVIVDFIWGLIQGNYITVSKSFCYVYNVVYYGVVTMLSCLWALYTISYINPSVFKKRTFVLEQFIPFGLLILLMSISCFTHVSFWVNDNLEYMKGPLYFMQLVFECTPIAYATIYAVINALKKDNFAMKGEYLSLSSFAIFPCILGICQVFFLFLPLLSAGIMMGILLVFLNMTEARISIDPLTKINNRNLLNYNLHKEMKDSGKNDSLYLVMMDADRFKEINDTYGHSEGDTALIEISNVLKRACADHRNCSVYRYGGDEFVMIVKDSSQDEMELICEEMNGYMDELNCSCKYPYSIKISIGYTKYNSSMESVMDFIKAADKKLYEIKKSRKAENR